MHIQLIISDVSTIVTSLLNSSYTIFIIKCIFTLFRWKYIQFVYTVIKTQRNLDFSVWMEFQVQILYHQLTNTFHLAYIFFVLIWRMFGSNNENEFHKEDSNIFFNHDTKNATRITFLIILKITQYMVTKRMTTVILIKTVISGLFWLDF